MLFQSRSRIISIDGMKKVYRDTGGQNKQFNFNRTTYFGGGLIMVCLIMTEYVWEHSQIGADM